MTDRFATVKPPAHMLEWIAHQRGMTLEEMEAREKKDEPKPKTGREDKKQQKAVEGNAQRVEERPAEHPIRAAEPVERRGKEVQPLHRKVSRRSKCPGWFKKGGGGKDS